MRRASLPNQPRGLVLVTGPTGFSNDHAGGHGEPRQRKRIRAYPDYRRSYQFVHQSNKRRSTSEVSPHPFFRNALRSALREDPDVILVGEMRDLETIRLALTAAETGHLVFGTLHTSSAAKTIDRIVVVFPGEDL